MEMLVVIQTAVLPGLKLVCACFFLSSALLLSLVVDRRDRQERWEGGVMTCDKGCMPDWRVHSMRLSHLSCHDTIKPRGL